MLNGSGIRINKLSYKRKEIEREEYSCTQGCSSPSFFVSGRQAKYAENNPCHSTRINNHEKFHCYRIVTGPEVRPVTAAR